MEFLVEYCQAVFQTEGSLIFTLFLGGLFGSLTHCAGMCGPFVLAQVGADVGACGKAGLFTRLKGAALVPYHLGRMTTYMLLGIAAASMSGYLFSVPVQRGIAVVMLCLAALLFLVNAVPSAKPALMPAVLSRAFGRFGGQIGEFARPFFRSPSATRRFGLGLILGFLPCGLLAAALMAVAATADPVPAALGMAAFCVGTMPALFLVGSGGRFAITRWPNHMATAVRGVMVFNSISLFVMASSMVF